MVRTAQVAMVRTAQAAMVRTAQAAMVRAAQVAGPASPRGHPATSFLLFQ
jgi:hypothetical protein